MGASERIVRHLRLRADSRAGVRRAALKLEDALRCASLPDAGARVLLVRRLELGLIAAGASPQTLSLLLEQRVAAAGGTWVHGADPNADRAVFVFFRDALEARCELALRLADAAPCAAWFWPLAVPEFEPAEGAQANLRRIALAIAALPEAPAALPAWVAHLTAAGVVRMLAEVIGSEAALLLRAAQLSVDAPRSRTNPVAPSELPQLASGALDVEHAESPQSREIEPAFAALPIWAKTLALAGGFVPRVVSVAPVARAAQAGSAAAPNRTGIEPTGQWPREAEAALTGVGPETRAKDMHEPPVLRQIKGDTAHAPDLPKSARAQAAPEPGLSGGPFPDAVPSAYGGLLFLLPVLHRLGYAAWAEALPEGAAAQVLRQMLALVLRRLHAPPDDPAWLLATAFFVDDFGDIDAKAPTSWGDPTLAAPRGLAAKDIVAALAEQAQPAAALARIWLIACRRWLRRVAGIGVASLVMRPAGIGLTGTHADVFFRLSDADVRVRRAGLDFEPGWNPWLGRVISFHYIEELTSVAAQRAGEARDGG